MAKYPALFDDSLGKLNTTRVTLRVKDDHPVFMKCRTIPFAIKRKYEESLKKLEADGIIRKVDFSKWVSPSVPVRKPDGSIRICADYSHLRRHLLCPDPHAHKHPASTSSRLGEKKP